jgi:hypothetical protein
LLPLYLLSASFRRFWHRRLFQPEQAIRPLAIADVSGFDLVLLGTPKWLYLSYPVARWLATVCGFIKMGGEAVGVPDWAAGTGMPIPCSFS